MYVRTQIRHRAASQPLWPGPVIFIHMLSTILELSLHSVRTLAVNLAMLYISQLFAFIFVCAYFSYLKKNGYYTKC